MLNLGIHCISATSCFYIKFLLMVISNKKKGRWCTFWINEKHIDWIQVPYANITTKNTCAVIVVIIITNITNRIIIFVNFSWLGHTPTSWPKNLLAFRHWSSIVCQSIVVQTRICIVSLEIVRYKIR